MSHRNQHNVNKVSNYKEFNEHGFDTLGLDNESSGRASAEVAAISGVGECNFQPVGTDCRGHQGPVSVSQGEGAEGNFRHQTVQCRRERLASCTPSVAPSASVASGDVSVVNETPLVSQSNLITESEVNDGSEMAQKVVLGNLQDEINQAEQ